VRGQPVRPLPPPPQCARVRVTDDSETDPVTLLTVHFPARRGNSFRSLDSRGGSLNPYGRREQNGGKTWIWRKDKTRKMCISFKFKARISVWTKTSYNGTVSSVRYRAVWLRGRSALSRTACGSIVRLCMPACERSPQTHSDFVSVGHGRRGVEGLR
jgi:hypothetical protein